MIAGILILAVILFYAGWVVRRKMKRIQAGQFCDCAHCQKACGKDRCVYNGEMRNGEWI